MKRRSLFTRANICSGDGHVAATRRNEIDNVNFFVRWLY